MTINPETDIVATSYNPATHAHAYTIARAGKQWTITISDEEFRQFGPVMGANAALNKGRRRQYLATRLQAAMQGSADA